MFDPGRSKTYVAAIFMSAFGLETLTHPHSKEGIMRTAIRLALALAFTVGVTSAALAQNGLTVALGPKVGVNFANVTGSDVSGTDSKTGFALGMAADFSFNEMWGIWAEAYYSMMGMKGDDFFGVPIDFKGSINYIQIPVLAKFTIPTNSSVSPYLFAGPMFSFKISCSVKDETANESFDCDEVFVSGVEVKSLDIGFAIGGGVGFPVGSGRLGFDVRYGRGFTELIDAAGTSVDIKNNLIQIAATWMFPLGK
jgi:hypothetical protein